jgi:UDP-glucose 4-epimerase
LYVYLKLSDRTFPNSGSLEAHEVLSREKEPEGEETVLPPEEGDEREYPAVRLLVTGGAGYIGSVVASQLVEEGHEVMVLDNLSKGHRRAIPDGTSFVRGDLLDAERLTRLLATGFDGVLHFAALSLVGESVEQPGRYYRTNVQGTLNLLEGMLLAEVPRFVFSSTAAAYGEPEEIPIPETASTRATNPYGGSKLAVDSLIGFHAAAHDLRATSLRYFNVAGASTSLGEDHRPETHVIPLVLEAAAGRRASVEIYGIDYQTSDGTAVRDYIHVEDLARAHLLALEGAKSGEHSIYNLGNGSGFSVREVVQSVQEVTGRKIEIIEAPRRVGDPAVLVASSRKIREELGWPPKKPELEVMIADAWEWMLAHPYGYRSGVAGC